MMISTLGGCVVHMLDFAPNCLDPDVRNSVTNQDGRVTFTEHDLLMPVPTKALYGYCTDVMEHIQPQHVKQVLANI